MAFFILGHYLSADGTFLPDWGSKHDPTSRSNPFAGLQHRPPVAGTDFLQQQNLNLSPRIGFEAPEARRNYPRVVQHKHVTRPQMLSELAEVLMPQSSRGAVNHQEPRSIPFRGRMLGDQFGRKWIVKLGSLHRGLRMASK